MAENKNIHSTKNNAPKSNTEKSPAPLIHFTSLLSHIGSDTAAVILYMNIIMANRIRGTAQSNAKKITVVINVPPLIIAVNAAAVSTAPPITSPTIGTDVTTAFAVFPMP